MPGTSEITTVLVTASVVGLVVVFHYEVFQYLNRWIKRRLNEAGRAVHSRPIILMVMFVLILAHVVEIWLFGTAYFLLLSLGEFGSIDGYDEISFLDCVYFSASTYTTVGWGELTATGNIRLLAGTEALVGFMLITWSASFGYLVMSETLSEDTDA